MYSDAWFSHSAHAAIKLHLEHVPSPVFYYLFAHRGEMSMSERFGDEFNDYGKVTQSVRDSTTGVLYDRCLSCG